MNTVIQEDSAYIEGLMKKFKLVDMRTEYKSLVHDAESTNMSHLEFLKKLLEIEAEGKKKRKQEKKDAMESLIKELISDRLLELSRYIVMDTSNRTIMIDVTTMKADGYQVITH